MRHLDLHLLQAVLEGDLPPKALLRHLLEHLRELCPECNESIAALRQGMQQSVGTGGGVELQAQPPTRAALLPEPRLMGVLDRTQTAAAEWTKKVRREQRRARADLRELKQLPAAKRIDRIENARSRFRSRALAEMLLEESRRLVRTDAAEAHSLARLVEPVLLWTPGALGQEWARELSIQAAAAEANALRVAGSLREADRRFGRLREQLARELPLAESVHAEVASLEASLRIDQNRLMEARRLLDQAQLLYRQNNEPVSVAKVLIKLAIVEARSGQLSAAVDVQREALTLLETSGDRSLLLTSVRNLALDLHEMGQSRSAEELLDQHRSAMVHAGVWDWPQAQTLRGRLALAAGDADEAERLFLAARAELIRRRDVVYAAVASFDLAVLYLSQGRTGELRRMARLMGQVFEAEDLHEEAMATVVLFQQAVAAESVTLEALRAWRRQLESGGGRPVRRQPARPS